MTDCLFCKIAKKEIAAEIVLETDDCIAFKDINPVAPHHYLVIPRKHFISLAEIDKNSSAELISAVQALTLKLGLKDFRTIFNTGKKVGQTVFHIHAHVIAGGDMEWTHG